MLLDVSDLSLARGGVRILDGVTFRVAAGEALLLRGPNGIGKTTLLRTLAGLQPAVSGTISAAPESLAYAGHLDGIKATLSVVENLRFWADVFGGDGIHHAMQAFDLEPLMARAGGQLSAGQKRRLGLARLLVTGRPVWLLDEPTVSLDANAKTQFEDAVTKHLEGGGAVVAATHLDIGLQNAATLDLAEFKAKTHATNAFDEAFL
jgi:heme exporter protein A